ncbi:MAG: hypothetical protein SA378_08775 [Sedimentibacter sp.]|uniref:hypothetical protein n=1 Tax=Sedimentibacter sp. TaxID=1960295 RepID=UPI0029814B1B|nr:hypothetical protein [Sedimentibacter sp.]MDW5300215.1 hypothetical protein [Sedimentibacter sp.]
MKIFDISKFTEDELLQIYNSLNSWQWNELLGEKPKNWDSMKRWHNSIIGRLFLKSKRDIISPINRQIRDEVGLNKILKWHWINNLGKTKEEYETWISNEMANNHLRF